MIENNYKGYCITITNCIKQHLEWSDMQLFSDVIEILETQGWQKLLINTAMKVLPQSHGHQ